eukprot:3249743-Amphidinium_carterae.1
MDDWPCDLECSDSLGAKGKCNVEKCGKVVGLQQACHVPIASAQAAKRLYMMKVDWEEGGYMCKSVLQTI